MIRRCVPLAPLAFFLALSNGTARATCNTLLREAEENATEVQRRVRTFSRELRSLNFSSPDQFNSLPRESRRILGLDPTEIYRVKNVSSNSDGRPTVLIEPESFPAQIRTPFLGEFYLDPQRLEQGELSILETPRETLIGAYLLATPIQMGRVAQSSPDRHRCFRAYRGRIFRNQNRAYSRSAREQCHQRLTEDLREFLDLNSLAFGERRERMRAMFGDQLAFLHRVGERLRTQRRNLYEHLSTQLLEARLGLGPSRSILHAHITQDLTAALHEEQIASRDAFRRHWAIQNSEGDEHLPFRAFPELWCQSRGPYLPDHDKLSRYFSNSFLLTSPCLNSGQPSIPERATGYSILIDRDLQNVSLVACSEVGSALLGRRLRSCSQLNVMNGAIERGMTFDLSLQTGSARHVNTGAARSDEVEIAQSTLLARYYTEIAPHLPPERVNPQKQNGLQYPELSAFVDPCAAYLWENAEALLADFERS